MNKNKDLKLDNIDKDFISVDDEKGNQSITNNNYSINNTDNGLKPPIRKTKTSKAISPKKEKNKSKKCKSPNRTKKTNESNDKKVKFKEKVDIIKVECWKQYNIEQTAEECEYIDDFLDDDKTGNTQGKNKDKDKDNNKNDKKSDNEDKKKEKNKDRRNRNNNRNTKGKKGNYTCTCIII